MTENVSIFKKGAKLEDELIATENYVDTLHSQVTQQLAETVKLDDTGVLGLNVFDEPTRNVLQGQEPGTINAVLGYKNVKEDNLDDNIVTKEKIDSKAVGKNHLDSKLEFNKPTYGADAMDFNERRSRLPQTAKNYKIVSDPFTKSYSSEIQAEWGANSSFKEIDGGGGVRIYPQPDDKLRISKALTDKAIYPYLSFNLLANEHLDSLTIELVAASGFSSYVISDITVGMNHIIVNKAKFKKDSGSLDWGNVDNIRFVAKSKASGRGEVVIGKIDTYEFDAFITIWFDDGHHTVYNHAKPIMDQYGFVGTHAIVGTWIGNQYMMNRKQLYEMANEGWEHCSHGFEHVRQRDMTPFQAELELQRNLDYCLTHNFGKSSYYYVNPGSSVNQDTEPTVKKYSTLSRRGLGHNLLPITDMYNIHSYEPHYFDSAEVAFEWIDQAIEGGLWTGLLFHTIRPDAQANALLRYPETEFDRIMNYLKEKQDAGELKVLTCSEVLSHI